MVAWWCLNWDFGGAAVLGWRRRRGDILPSSLGSFTASFWFFFLSRTNLDIASSWFQAVLVLPALTWGLGYLAYSMGELFGVIDLRSSHGWRAGG